MAIFVHLADERQANKIIADGLNMAKVPWRKINGVFAMPITSSYYLTHQWQRELKRRGVRSYIGIQFRIPDQELVYIGKYNQEKLETTAAAAVGIVMEHDDGQGLEVIIPRRIDSKEMMRKYNVSDNVGWRYFPRAHGKKPCGCQYCQRGQINSRRLQDRYDQDL